MLRCKLTGHIKFSSCVERNGLGDRAVCAIKLELSAGFRHFRMHVLPTPYSGRQLAVGSRRNNIAVHIACFRIARAAGSNLGEDAGHQADSPKGDHLIHAAIRDDRAYFLLTAGYFANILLTAFLMGFSTLLASAAW